MKNNKGFTLIEVLAVIVLLGIIMSVAIVAISGYVEESKLKAYVNIAKEYIDIASIEIAKNEIVARDKNTVYYIHIDNLEAESDLSKSPFGDWIDAYVVVVIDPDTGDYNYYWTSVDEAGYRVDETLENELDINSIYVSKDLTITPSYPIGGRDNVAIYDETGEKITTEPVVEMKTEDAESCFTYIIEDAGIAILDYNTSCGKNVVIPSSIEDVNVYRIGVGAFKNKSLTNVTIYKGVELIEYGAFQGNNLNTVKLAISIKTVGDYAFYNSKIKNLVMSEGLKSIGSYAFANNNICSVNIPSSVTSIGGWAFANNCLTDVDLPPGVGITGGTFSGNDISDNSAFIYKKNADGSPDYSSIVSYAGNKVDNLVIPSVKNGVELKRIEGNAFSGVGLKGKLIIPSTVTYIGGDAFAFNSIEEVVFPDGLKTIETGAFRSNKLTSINIPDSVTTLGNYAFNTNEVNGQAGIIYARDSSGIRYDIIASYAGGKSVSGSISIPPSKNGVKLRQIRASAFADCNLTNIILPNISDTNNMSISTNAFIRNKVSSSSSSPYNSGGFFCKVSDGNIDCSSIASYAGPTSGTITIPSSINGKNVTNIQAGFTWMSYSEIVIPSTVTSISSGVFAKSARNNQKLKTIVNKTGKSFNWASLTSSSITANNTFVTGTIQHNAGNIEVVSE